MTTTTTYYPGTVDQTAAQSIVVAAGETIGNVVFTIQSSPAFRVSGVVIDTAGNPVAGAMVMLIRDPRSGGGFFGPGGSARTAQDGSFVMNDVTPGSYRVSASVPMMTNGSGGGFISSSAQLSGGQAGPPIEISVMDADVKSLRVTVRQP
jgi:hypothetical protein